MIEHFITTHRLLAYAAMTCLFALSGYAFSRVSPERPLAAIGSWAFGLLYLAFGLATVGILRPAGPLAALAVLVGGGIWIARYYERHRSD